ncbi:MAG: FkbM family methyltransferase [Nitrospira sp.]|nr:FkbM family methyltransferase [Nitrospira sp.]
MNRGIWFFFEVVFDTLMFAPYLLRGQFPARIKARILWWYLLVTIKLLLVNPFRPLTQDRVWGFTVRCLDYRTLHLLLRVILLRNEYYFQTANAHPVIFDCGANIGLATLFFKWLHPGSDIHAFEPDPDTFALLKWNVETNNLTGVHLYNVALSDVSGTASFHVDHSRPGSPRMSLQFERMPKDTIAVNTLVLSSVLREQLAGRALDFLKIDVEGAEAAVLSDLIGSGQLPAVKEMLIEYHHKIAGARGRLGEFLTALETQGFDYQLDAVCMPIYGPQRFQNVILYAYRMP